MESQREEEEVVSGVQRRLATNRAPSDAAKKRVEERATRNGTTTRSINAQTVPASSPPSRPPPAPVVVDLLDFGDFDSPEAAFAVQESVVTSNSIDAASPAPILSTGPPPTNKEPAEFDVFASMSIGNNNSDPNRIEGSVPDGSQIMQPQPVQRPQVLEQKKMTTEDILSMFNVPSAQKNSMQQNTMFAGAGMNGMSSGNGLGIMNNNTMSPLQQSMNMMNNINHLQPMGMMSNNLNPQQQMAMINNMQMLQMQHMMGHQGMNNMGGNMNMGVMGGQGVSSSMGSNNMMMMQQGQIPQMNNNMMMMQGGGGGGIMHGGNQFVQPMMGQAMQQQQQGQSSPQIQQQGGGAQHMNQFADFGNFAR